MRRVHDCTDMLILWKTRTDSCVHHWRLVVIVAVDDAFACFVAGRSICKMSSSFEVVTWRRPHTSQIQIRVNVVRE